MTEHYFLTVRDTAYTYTPAVFESGLKYARDNNIPFSQDGNVINCPTIENLESLYNMFFTGPNAFLRVIYNSGYQFKDLGRRIYFKVNGMTVQIWALCAENTGKLTEGAGGTVVYIPVYCSFNAITDLVFDSVHVASVSF